MNELMINDIKVEDLIYEVRGKQVMLASDVARLYQVETRALNQVVKRNLNRFPEDWEKPYTRFAYCCPLKRSGTSKR